jgi:hypothetical protein
VDTLNSVQKSYADVLRFVMNEDVALHPLAGVRLVEGRYHA